MKSSTVINLRGMRDRVVLLAGLTAASGNLTGLDKSFELALDESQEKADEKAKAEQECRELMEKARHGDHDAVMELNELRMEYIDLYVRATSQFASLFYETITLKDKEQFCVEHSYRVPVGIRYIGQDGGARGQKLVKARKQTFIDVRELTSNDIGYQMRDIQQGSDVAAAAQATVDLGWDMANMVDAEAFNLLVGGTINSKSYGTGVYGAFKTTGSALDKTWIPNVRIATSNLPTTNDYKNADLDDAGAKTGFRLAVIRKIMAHCDAFGTVLNGPLRPTGAILIPSSETTGLTSEIVPTGTFYNQVAEGILQQYTRFSYMGINWTLVPDVTLPPGTCYPVLNRPVGKILVKPSMDQEFVESFPRKNWETRTAMKVLAMTFFEPWRAHALRITYAASTGTVTTNE